MNFDYFFSLNTTETRFFGKKVGFEISKLSISLISEPILMIFEALKKRQAEVFFSTLVSDSIR